MSEKLEERIEKLNGIKDDIIKKMNKLKEDSLKDLEIQDFDLDTASLKTPVLFGKYNNLYSDEAANFRSLLKAKDKVFVERSKFLLGKQNNKYYSDYGLQPEKILKSELDIYIKVDPIYSIMNEIVSLQKIYVDSIEKITKEITGRGYHIKAAIDWRKFTSGA